MFLKREWKTVLWKLLTVFSKKWRRWVISFKGKIWVFAARPDPARPGPAPSRSLKPYISGTTCLIDKRSSLMNTTWMLKLYGMVTVLRQCRSWHVARAKLGVLWTARPGPIALFKALYLRNRTSDRQAVFFDEYHLDVKVVWHCYHIASVPVMARGACQTLGTWDDPQNTTSITAQRLDRMGWDLVYLQLGTQQTVHVCGPFLGASARAHVHTPLLYLENGWTDCADIWHVASRQLVMWLPHV